MRVTDEDDNKSDIEIAVELEDFYINLGIKHKSRWDSSINPLDLKNKIIDFIKREIEENKKVDL